MIQVKPVIDKNYLECASCGAKEAVHILIGDERRLNSLRLCRNCINELKNKVDEIALIQKNIEME